MAFTIYIFTLSVVLVCNVKHTYHQTKHMSNNHIRNPKKKKKET
jgi:predicted membrane channel-forming protein YqfA (hemolysin III family)